MNTKRVLLPLLLLLLLPLMVAAQQSDQQALKVLDKAASVYNKAGGVVVGFELTTENKRTGAMEEIGGEIQMKGAKSYLKTDAAEVWFDGKNQWSYYHDAGEVNLSLPTINEMEVYNPSILFRTYKKAFLCTYVGSRKMGGQPLEVVELRPTDGNTNIVKITCRFNGASQLHSVEVVNKTMSEVRLKITKYETARSLPDATFVFNPTAHPDVEVIDLR